MNINSQCDAQIIQTQIIALPSSRLPLVLKAFYCWDEAAAQRLIVLACPASPYLCSFRWIPAARLIPPVLETCPYLELDESLEKEKFPISWTLLRLTA